MTMTPGDVVVTRRISALFSNTKVSGTADFKAAKGGALVFLYLGDDRPGDPPIDPISVLYDLGWTCPKFPDPRAPKP